MGGLLIVARIMWGVRWVVVRVPWPEEVELGIVVLLGDDEGAGAACAARAKKRKGVGVKKKLVGEYMMMKAIFAL